MSNVKVFSAGEWWRLLFHMYLHAGVLHMAFNIFALLPLKGEKQKFLRELQSHMLFHQ